MTLEATGVIQVIPASDMNTVENVKLRIQQNVPQLRPLSENVTRPNPDTLVKDGMHSVPTTQNTNQTRKITIIADHQTMILNPGVIQPTLTNDGNIVMKIVGPAVQTQPKLQIQPEEPLPDRQKQNVDYLSMNPLGNLV